MSIYVFLNILVSTVAAYFCGRLALRLGRDPVLWAIMGFLFSVFALILLVFLGAARRRGAVTPPRGWLQREPRPDAGGTPPRSLPAPQPAPQVGPAAQPPRVGPGATAEDLEHASQLLHAPSVEAAELKEALERLEHDDSDAARVLRRDLDRRLRYMSS